MWGKEKELEFLGLYAENREATEDENINKHIDGWIYDGQWLSVDVKEMKKVRRSDPQVNEHIHYVEIYNVNGDRGWVYGEANVIAFETEDYWVLVMRKDLVAFIEDKVDKTKTPAPRLYKLYQRLGRKDLMTLVKTIDLCYLATEIMKKDIVNNT